VKFVFTCISPARLAALLVAAAIRPASARAEPAADAGTASDAELRSGADTSPPPYIVLPKLLQAFPAEYPWQAAAAGVEGTVVLLLTIGDDGRVTDASVLESPGYGLDEAARTAALRFRFEQLVPETSGNPRQE
jgi:vitamin B12 transporter